MNASKNLVKSWVFTPAAYKTNVIELVQIKDVISFVDPVAIADPGSSHYFRGPESARALDINPIVYSHWIKGCYRLKPCKASLTLWKTFKDLLKSALNGKLFDTDKILQASAAGAKQYVLIMECLRILIIASLQGWKVSLLLIIAHLQGRCFNFASNSGCGRECAASLLKFYLVRPTYQKP